MRRPGFQQAVAAAVACSCEGCRCWPIILPALLTGCLCACMVICLQVVDAAEGPSTKREYEQMLVPGKLSSACCGPHHFQQCSIRALQLHVSALLHVTAAAAAAAVGAAACSASNALAAIPCFAGCSGRCAGGASGRLPGPALPHAAAAAGSQQQQRAAAPRGRGGRRRSGCAHWDGCPAAAAQWAARHGQPGADQRSAHDWRASERLWGLLSGSVLQARCAKAVARCASAALILQLLNLAILCPLQHVQALDILTPLGRGQALQVVGPQGSGKTQVGAHAVLCCAGHAVVHCACLLHWITLCSAVPSARQSATCTVQLRALRCSLLASCAGGRAPDRFPCFCLPPHSTGSCASMP